MSRSLVIIIKLEVLDIQALSQVWELLRGILLLLDDPDVDVRIIDRVDIFILIVRQGRHRVDQTILEYLAGLNLHGLMPRTLLPSELPGPHRF